MTKLDLLRLLSTYPDDLELLVESPSGGFDEPTLYVTGVRPRRAEEFQCPRDSEYVGSRDGETSMGVLVFGSALGCASLSL